MIISGQTPTRISLFGGGTDIYPYAEDYGGIVIGMAINLHQKMKVFLGEDIFQADYNSFPYRASPEFYFKIFNDFGLDGMHHFRINAKFDGFIESGLGSSGSAAVLLVGLLNKALSLNMSRSQIANRAWNIEVNKMKKSGGKQDQILLLDLGMK